LLKLLASLLAVRLTGAHAAALIGTTTALRFRRALRGPKSSGFFGRTRRRFGRQLNKAHFVADFRAGRRWRNRRQFRRGRCLRFDCFGWFFGNNGRLRRSNFGRRNFSDWRGGVNLYWRRRRRWLGRRNSGRWF
jgi:hypothetical protein